MVLKTKEEIPMQEEATNTTRGTLYLKKIDLICKRNSETVCKNSSV